MTIARIPVLRDIAQLAPLRDSIFYDSFGGAFSDSPRAIYEELVRRNGHHSHVWVRKNDKVDMPAGVHAVAPNSFDYLRQLGSAKYVFSSAGMPGYYRKRSGATYVQTWHGTPLKRIAFDIPSATSEKWARYLHHLANDVRKWDYLVSPNPFSTEIFRRAFRFDGEILETGYPRNDILNDPERDALARRVREHLGVPADKKAVLYAPTWRDNAVDASGNQTFSLQFDLSAMREKLGDEYVVLLRLHPLVANAIGDINDDFVRNASKHPDIRELYLAADLLLTDYSSVMFDFAITGKPIFFFTYDLAEYRDNLRGFYFDFESDAPGPLLESTGDVIDALTNRDRVVESHRDRYDAFRRRFCSLEDGHASARVIDAVFRT